jgi:hypothetical protein
MDVLWATRLLLLLSREAATHNGRIINEMTFLEQLNTPHYLWLSLWSFICIYRIMFLLGSVFGHLLLVGDRYANGGGSVYNYGNIGRCEFNQYHPPDNTLVGLSPAVCETTLVVGYSCFSGVRLVNS